MKEKNRTKNKAVRAGKECAYIAVFVALLIGSQLALSVLPGVETVTVLFLSYAFVFGVRRGMLAATAFSLLRQLIFGFFPTVLVLYLLYYNFLTFLFGWIGKRWRATYATLWLYILLACLCTVIFTLLDDTLTPLWYGYTSSAAKAYFVASLPVLVAQLVCTAVTVGTLFIPLRRAFLTVKKGL